MSGNHSRNKGARSEREVVAILKANGLKAERTFQQLAGDRADIRMPGYAVEVKRVKDKFCIWPALKQTLAAAASTETPLLAFRRDRDGWWGCLPVDDFTALTAICGETPVVMRDETKRFCLWPELEAAVRFGGPKTAWTFHREDVGHWAAVQLNQLAEMIKEASK